MLVAIALIVAMAGCGGTATLVDPSVVNQSSKLKTSTPTPVIAQATPTPPPPKPVNAQLLASVANVKKALLGLGKCTATITVSNPSPITLTGTVQVTFTKKGVAASEQPQTKSVTLAPNAQQNLTFTSTSWFLDGATVSVQADNGGFDPHGGSSSGYGGTVGGGYSSPGTY
jgi:glucose/arabinose dehydrogenase